MKPNGCQTAPTDGSITPLLTGGGVAETEKLTGCCPASPQRHSWQRFSAVAMADTRFNSRTSTANARPRGWTSVPPSRSTPSKPRSKRSSPASWLRLPSIPETARWVASLANSLHVRFAEFGLIESRQSTAKPVAVTLVAFPNDYH